MQVFGSCEVYVYRAYLQTHINTYKHTYMPYHTLSYLTYSRTVYTYLLRRWNMPRRRNQLIQKRQIKTKSTRQVGSALPLILNRNIRQVDKCRRVYGGWCLKLKRSTEDKVKSRNGISNVGLSLPFLIWSRGRIDELIAFVRVTWSLTETGSR